MSSKGATRYEGRFCASIAYNHYQMKFCIMFDIFQPTSSGRTNLFYLPKYFRKGKGERKDRTKEVMGKGN